jgi:hypothetical protein
MPSKGRMVVSSQNGRARNGGRSRRARVHNDLNEAAG